MITFMNFSLFTIGFLFAASTFCLVAFGIDPLIRMRGEKEND